MHWKIENNFSRICFEQGATNFWFVDLKKGTVVVAFDDIIELWDINSRKSKFSKKFENFKYSYLFHTKFTQELLVLIYLSILIFYFAELTTEMYF